jgi:DNA-binding MarR family transcriptional regulator
MLYCQHNDDVSERNVAMDGGRDGAETSIVDEPGECPSSWRVLTPDGSDLSLEHFPSFRLVVASTHLHRTVTSAYLRPYGVKLPEWRILATVARWSSVSMPDLCVRSNMDKALISRTVKSLEAARLIVRRPDPTHGKRQILRITPAGRRLFERILPAAQRSQAELLARLTQAERIAFYSALEKLRGVKPPAPAENRGRGGSRRKTPC